MTLTGQDLLDLLEQQWAGQPFPRILEPSGFSYTWSEGRPAGSRILAIRIDATTSPADPSSAHRLARSIDPGRSAA